jgi:hypothetical protein
MGERSKAGNAARLEAMAADSFAKVFGPDAAKINRAVDGISGNDPERDTASAALAYIEVLDAVQAELDRLRAIVDLACAEHEANQIHTRLRNATPSLTWEAWDNAMAARQAAVAAEVARRAAL